MDIAIIGTGYVGLVAGTCLADLGHRVRCVDADPRKVELLNSGGLPIYEPGLEELVPANMRAGRLSFGTDLAEAVSPADVVYIAVGTPPGEDGSADLQYVQAAATSIADALVDHTVVVVKSTVPVGTCDRVREILTSRTDVPFDVVSNPEFLREGVAIPDFMDPDRIVIGCDTDRARKIMASVYATQVDKGVELLVMDVRSAELTKYASNAMLATRISFMNEVARLCSQLGADVEHVRQGMGTDSRIGPAFLRAGVGYGGSCFPKDVQALMSTGEQYQCPMRIIEAVEAVNARQKRWMLEQVLHDLGGDLANLRMAVWGLAFKPDTDDMREAPSLTIIEGLLEAGAVVTVHDPVAEKTTRPILGDRVQYCDDPYDCLQDADALLLVTEWSVFRSPDWDRVRSMMRRQRVYDGRNLWSSDALRTAGFTYWGIGRA
ncbi:MAG: UDP-glucose/GDP-mannose dehydrogenase family protein [Myxococcota bacterium]|nr:UDP-glucose/GDP-mannose dehydrogenase family protein [Myxococcota bacterium]